MSGAVAATVAVLALAGSASVTDPPPGFYEATALESAASSVAGKRAHVYCADNWSIWAETANGNDTPNAVALTHVGADRSLFAPLICSTLRAQLGRRQVTPYALAESLRILVHEAVHQRGVAIEGRAECSAMHEMGAVAVRFFGVEPGDQLRVLMARAWESHDAGPMYFRTDC